MALRNVLSHQRKATIVLARTLKTSSAEEKASQAKVQLQDAAPLQRPRIPHRSSFEREKCIERQDWVEQFSGSQLNETRDFWKDESINTTTLKGNIEMPIGMAKIPLAVAGPLLFSGTEAVGYHLLPMATTEGALLASVTRGAALLSECGGVVTHAGEQQMTRAPLFLTRHPSEAVILGNWIQKNKERIQEEVISKFSRVAKIKTIMPIYDQEVYGYHIIKRYCL